MIGEETLRLIAEEAARQDIKWGETNHSPEMWMIILMEEVGELAETVLAYHFGRDLHSSYSDTMRTEAIQAAAVLGQFLECLNRLGL